MSFAALFSPMAVHLASERVMTVYESAEYLFPDEQRRFVVTIRRGIAEIAEGEPLPGTPASGETYRSERGGKR
jgi:alkyl sulfatase BDS1-like metallo-beta-lactamase superfamily hydrolase